MSAHHRIIIAIEKNELRFWELVHRLLRHARPRLDGALAPAIAWSQDAIRARREEIVVLEARAKVRERVPSSGGAAPVPRPESSPRLAA